MTAAETNVRWSGPCSQLARVLHNRGANTRTGKKKNTPVTSSQMVPPTRPKGRRNPPMPRTTPLPARPAASLLLQLAAFALGIAGAAGAEPLIRSLATRPATRNPTPSTRPIFSGFIFDMMVAAARRVSLCANSLAGPVAPGVQWQ